MPERVYILGGGAIGLALAANLGRAGRRPVLVRICRDGIPFQTVEITVQNDAKPAWNASVETVSLSRLQDLNGLIVVAVKSYVNTTIARSFRKKGVSGPIVVMQNGIGVEKPFLESGFAKVYRSVLYVTGQTVSENEVNFRSVTSSPIGVIEGSQNDIDLCVEALTTPVFPFHAERNIRREIWKKTIMNSVFNSICPLLDVDNGIFARDDGALALAREVVEECVALAKREGISLAEPELMESILGISKGSPGVLISTLQDIRNGRRTEMDSLNLEMARIASASPSVALTKTELLGRMTLQKAKLGLRH